MSLCRIIIGHLDGQRAIDKQDIAALGERHPPSRLAQQQKSGIPRQSMKRSASRRPDLLVSTVVDVAGVAFNDSVVTSSTM